jgi:hypothetical protein
MGKESDTDQPAEIVREYGPFPAGERGWSWTAHAPRRGCLPR